MQVAILEAALASRPEMLEAGKTFLVVAHDQRLAHLLRRHFLLAAISGARSSASSRTTPAA